MELPQGIAARPITRQEWADIVAQFSGGRRTPNIKRRQPRFDAGGFARLFCKRRDGAREEQVCLRCSVLEKSNAGITLRCQDWLHERTDVAVELLLDDRPVVLLGRVVHCTQTVGAFKIGVQLKFIAEKARQPGD